MNETYALVVWYPHGAVSVADVAPGERAPVAERVWEPTVEMLKLVSFEKYFCKRYLCSTFMSCAPSARLPAVLFSESCPNIVCSWVKEIILVY